MLLDLVLSLTFWLLSQTLLKVESVIHRSQLEQAKANITRVFCSGWRLSDGYFEIIMPYAAYLNIICNVYQNNITDNTRICARH